MSLFDKVVVITGAGRPNGIGAGMARCFANEAAKVVSDLEGTPLDETAAAIVSAQTPLGAEQTPEDIGYLAVFFAPEKVRMITGQVVAVDGGISVA